jgi:hypothetical protein
MDNPAVADNGQMSEARSGRESAARGTSRQELKVTFRFIKAAK